MRVGLSLLNPPEADKIGFDWVCFRIFGIEIGFDLGLLASFLG